MGGKQAVEWSFTVMLRRKHYSRLLIADVSGNADETVTFSAVDERGQPAAHLTTSSALLRFTDDCHHVCVHKLITDLVNAAQQAGVWPCWQVTTRPVHVQLYTGWPKKILSYRTLTCHC